MRQTVSPVRRHGVLRAIRTRRAGRRTDDTGPSKVSDSGREVVVAASYRPVEGAHDAGGIVVRPLLEVGLAVQSESDPAGRLPRTEVRFCEIEVRVGVEAKGLCVLDGAEHQVLGEFDRGR